jgi:hypothetical protein
VLAEGMRVNKPSLTRPAIQRMLTLMNLVLVVVLSGCEIAVKIAISTHSPISVMSKVDSIVARF